MIVVKGVTVRVRVGTVLDVIAVGADDVVEDSLSVDDESLCVVEAATVVVEEAGIAGNTDRSLDAHITRTPWIANTAL